MKTSDEYSGLDECGSGDGCLDRFKFLGTQCGTLLLKIFENAINKVI